MDAISCLMPPSSLGLGGDTALARALHFSTMSDSASSSGGSSTTGHHHRQQYSPLLLCAADLAYMSPPVTACGESVLVSPRRSSPSQAQQRRQHLGPAAAGARAGKRRSRASKRAPTTYISTDPSNFRLMVQHVTGAQAEPVSPTDLTAFDASTSMLLLPHAADTNTLLPAVDHHHQQPQQPCFPTLDSWNVSCSSSMYERNHLLL